MSEANKKEKAKKSLLMRILSYSPARKLADNAPREKWLDKKKLKKFKFKR
jgi:hypothetical protein